jgi:hypothetical protein
VDWNACPKEDNARSGQLENMNCKKSGNVSHVHRTNIYTINTRMITLKRHINVMSWASLTEFNLTTPKRTAELKLLFKNAPLDAIPVL